MLHVRLHPCILALLTLVSAPLAARDGGIIPSPADSETRFHAEAGITFASGLENVVNQMEDNFGVDRDFVWPVGIKLSAYARQPSGWAFGGSVGPWTFIRVENDDDRYNRRHWDDDDDDEWSYIIPISADVRYFFETRGSIEPFVRAGVVFPISGGEHLGSGTPGPVVAAGAQVWDSRYVAIGMEAGYDGSQVKVKSGPLHTEEKVYSGEFTLSVFARF